MTTDPEVHVRYLLLLADAPDAWDDIQPPQDVDDGVIGDWAAYTRALESAGVLVAGAALHPVESATSVQVRNRGRLLTDGPFAETKEHLVGFHHRRAHTRMPVQPRGPVGHR